MPENYLGIDVGYSKSRRTTGLCLITIDQTSLQWRCCNTGTEESERWEDLRSLVPKGTSLAGVGIDGPLARDLKKVNDRYRSADALLSRGHFQRRGKPGPTNSPTGQDLHTHATKLAKLVISLWNEGYLDIQAAETTPTPFTRLAFWKSFLLPSWLCSCPTPITLLLEINSTRKDPAREEIRCVLEEGRQRGLSEAPCRDLGSTKEPRDALGIHKEPRPPRCLHMCSCSFVRSQKSVRGRWRPGGRPHNPATPSAGGWQSHPWAEGCPA